MKGDLSSKADTKYFSNIVDMKNILNGMKDSDVSTYYMTSDVTKAFFNIQASSKGIVSKVTSTASSTGFVYDFLNFSPTQILCSRYNPGTGVNSVYECNMKPKVDYTI